MGVVRESWLLVCVGSIGDVILWCGVGVDIGRCVGLIFVVGLLV